MKQTWRLLVLTLLAVAAGNGCRSGVKPTVFSSPAQQNPPERFTILLYVLRSADHTSRIQSFKRQTELDAGWRGLYVKNKTGHSELYLGKYATPAEAADDLKKAKKYRTPLDVAVYAQAMVIPLPGTDPGPPEWNLLNANGFYTIIVAVFYDQPEANYFGRKEYAVAYCKQLREKGEEAYFRHGSARSTVTIGAFPKDAIAMVKSGNLTKEQIRSQQMFEIHKRYPELAVNGRQELIWDINPVTGKAEQMPVRSYPAHIPGKKGKQQPDALDRLGYSQPR